MEEEDWRRKKSGALIALHFRLLPNGTRTNNESEFRTSDERERERERERGGGREGEAERPIVHLPDQCRSVSTDGHNFPFELKNRAQSG